MKKRTFNKVIFAAFSCQFLSIPLFAQQQKVDTTHTYSIPEITVSDIYQTREVRSTAPLQVFSKDALKNLHALQVSDAVKHFAGVTVKDYGGIGGLKTVSIRSLGAQHTAVGYDGITLTDCQTGQIDIGRFSLDNVDRLSLNNGQSDNIFQPARFFASAGILNIQTLTPLFTKGKKTNIAGAFKTGSWGLINPSLLLEQQFNKTWSMSANGEWMSSDGHYPYTLHYGNAAEDLSSREKRKNTDVQTFRAEAGLYGNFSDKEQWRLKAYYFQSSRGLPKATTFYNDHSTQHLWDKNTFIQSQYKKEFSRQWVFQTSAKWNWSYQRYLDPDTKNSLKKTENSYYQQEYYLSASVLYRLLSNLSFSLSTDGSINTMNADLANFVHPTRYSWLTAFAGKYVNDWLTISASALATVINEDVKKGGSAGNHRKLTPYVSAAFKPFQHEEFRIRFFYKDIFRLASFNDLYYEEVGNTQLKPEKAKQYNIGLTYNKNVCPFLPYLSVTVDAYYNKVTDKIIAYPTKNQPAATGTLHTPHQRKNSHPRRLCIDRRLPPLRASANPCPGHTLVHPLQPQRARIRQQRFHADRQRAETKTNGTFPLLDTAIDGCFRLYRKYHHRSQPVPVEEVLSGDQSGRLSAQGLSASIRPPHSGTWASGHQIYARKLKVIVT